MAALIQSRQFVNLEGNIALKGFSSLLIVVGVAADVVLWHFLFDSDGDRISYFDARLKERDIKTPDGLRLRDPENRRHIVGWCSQVRECAGEHGLSTTIYAFGLQHN